MVYIDKNCRTEKCLGILVFIDCSFEDNYSIGYYLCNECEKSFHTSVIEGDM